MGTRSRGSYRGQLRARSYELRIHAAAEPRSIAANGKALAPAWDPARSTAVVLLPRHSIRDRIEVVWR